MVPDMRREFGGTGGQHRATTCSSSARRRPHGDRRPRLRPLRASASRRLGLSRSTCACSTTSSPRRPSSPPTSTTTRSPPSTPARCRRSHLNRVADASGRDASRIVSPDGRDGMIEHARDFAAARDPLRLRPGPGPADVLRRRAARDAAAGRARSRSTTTRRAMVEQKTGTKRAGDRAHDRTRWWSRAAPRARPSSPAARTIDVAGGEARRGRSIPPAAATPTARACCYGMARGWDWEQVARGSPR